VVQREQKRLTREDDRALLRELVAGVVRRLPHLDRALEAHTEREMGRVQPELLQILRVGAYQILFLDRVPAYAAVHECVKAAKALNPGAGGFVNGVLRSLSEHREEALEAPLAFAGAEGAALRLGMPLWLVERYEARFGGEAEPLLRALAEPAVPSLLFLGAPAEAAGLPILSREGFRLERDPLLPFTHRVLSGDPSRSEAFRQGLFYVMDGASQVPALLLPVKPGERVLDLCAAPGGKSVRLALRTGGDLSLVAADRNRRRLRQMAENFRRLSLTGIRVAAVDAAAPLPFADPFDAVLLDAPCSSLGTLRKNPEIRWQMAEEDLKRHHLRQVILLQRAAEAVREGGFLLYSVCSLEPEETVEVVEAFLAHRPDFRPRPLEAGADLASRLTPAGEGMAYLLPHRTSWDGFFVALLRRKGAGRTRK
jgi:16S rRNA (cytosine967-C5)-methyltransferase